MANLDSIDLSISKGTLNEIDGSILDGQDVISTERLHKNDTLMGTYKVLSGPIKGGMGSVWCVRHLEDGNIMAMKRPQPKYFAEGSARRKEVFIRECESWIRLALHPNVVACFYVRDISGVPSIFSEWMDGGSLRDRIADGTLYSGTNKEKQARLLSIAIQTARGLLYAHQKGLVHRDMKPDNILLTKEFDAKVADFGLSVAKSALTSSADDPAAGTTPAGSPTLSEADIITMLTGKRPADTTPRKASGGYTRAYCSPEQLRGEVLTAATDIYSWAASMAEMYIGKKIWEKGEDAGSAFRNYSDAPCAAFPDGLRELLVRCMSVHVADRPADFSEIERKLLVMYRNTFGHGYEGEEEKAAPDSSDSLNNQAVSYMEIGLADKAEECWEEISRLDPSHPETLYNRALVNWRSGQVTGRKAANSLMSHPFFRESEEGKSRIAAMESEAGMTSFDEPLFESRHLVFAQETRPIQVIRDWQLCKGKLYILLSYLPAEEEQKEPDVNYNPVLAVFNPETGEKITEQEFPDIAAEGYIVLKASLSTDCRHVFFRTQDHYMISYDLAERKIHYKASVRPISVYSGEAGISSVGNSGRFVWRLIHYGTRSEYYRNKNSEIFELYDLKTGKRVDQYSDLQLIRAGDDPLPGKPDGERFTHSLSDGSRLIPVLEKGVTLQRCDMEGTPLGPINQQIVKDIYDRLGYRERKNSSFPRSIIRITEDGKLWRWDPDDDGWIMNYDVVSGKCLRTFQSKYSTRIDDDGLGIVGLLRFDYDDETGEPITERENRVLRWKYRKLLPVTDETRAKWAMAKPENYAEFTSRTRQLYALQQSFKESGTREDLCRIYIEASQIRRFYGSDAYFSMRKSLDSCCRQTDGYVSIIFDSDTSDADVKEMMKPFTPRPWDLPVSLQKRLEKTRWVTMPVILNPEGERALLFGKNQPLAYREPYTGENLFTTVARPPRGEGLYLLDANTEKMYFVRNMSPGGSARFCRGSRMIVSCERLSGPGPGHPMSFLMPMSPIKDVYGCTDSTMDGRSTRTIPKKYSGSGLHVISGFPGSPGQELKTLVWDNGAFVFPDAESYSAFADQPGRFEILDARDDCGLIAYEFEYTGGVPSSQRFRLWSIDENRNVLDVEAPTVSYKAAFSSPAEKDVRIMVCFTESRSTFDYDRIMLGMAMNDQQMLKDNLQSHDVLKNARIYQFTCSYAPLPSKRSGTAADIRDVGHAQSPAALPRIGLEECGWDDVFGENVLSGESEIVLQQKLKELRSRRNPTPAELSQIHLICCELAERFPGNASYVRDKEDVENELTKRFKKMTSLFGKDPESLKQFYKIYLQQVFENPKNTDYIKVFDDIKFYLGTVLAASSKDTRELQFALSLLESLVKRYPGNASIVKQRDRVRLMVNLRNT